ncbi:hypothetical protein DY023_10760 [Microbacterium bovistercoris]|uniref:Carboxypeptidase regulatory-like domain-containing protein n=1 Tax=Microbacterium bovistercoris TaxID=2293570 RepID=A0A371NS72_9MICO|nr:hypothetical protein [Microbacterium bovistercoris]REJ05062.1 hypothetical protein DY023_10760 [Microbacterium bovistercoris]
MSTTDDELMAALRALWQENDPVPADLAERMVAAVASDDLSREYALLTLVEDATAAVRGDTGTTTLQFSDGRVGVMLHVADAEGGGRRVDGWVDAESPAVVLEQGQKSWTAEPAEHGRFAFDRVPPGLYRLRLTVREDAGERVFSTPRFEI